MLGFKLNHVSKIGPRSFLYCYHMLIYNIMPSSFYLQEYAICFIECVIHLFGFILITCVCYVSPFLWTPVMHYLICTFYVYNESSAMTSIKCWIWIDSLKGYGMHNGLLMWKTLPWHDVVMIIWGCAVRCICCQGIGFPKNNLCVHGRGHKNITWPPMALYTERCQDCLVFLDATVCNT